MAGELHHYRECGLSNVFLLNGFTVQETRHGRAVSIEDMDGLHLAIGIHLAKKKMALTGAELRFLRFELGLSQKMLGALLGKNTQTVARWENGKSRIDSTAERLVRVLYIEQIGENDKIRNRLQELTVMNHLDCEGEFRFEDTAEGWRLHTAA